MSTKIIEKGASTERSNWRSHVLDLLTEPVQENSGILREGNDFVIEVPWALATFGPITLRRGWWIFECVGGVDVSGVELRLLSPEDTLIAFSSRRASTGPMLVQKDKSFDVSLLVSAWPGRVSLSLLRLRRLSVSEVVGLAGVMLSRFAKSDKPIAKLIHVTSRVVAGRSPRIKSPRIPDVETAPSTLPNHTGGAMRTVVAGDVTAVLRDDERLHPRAMEIVANAFARSAMLQAVYADLSEAGEIRPRPEWDSELAAIATYADSPVFFRGLANSSECWSRLKTISKETGAVGRIALPLGSRNTVIKRSVKPLPVPLLASPPLVSVIIPTKIRIDLLERCLEGLAERTGYPALEVLIVNGSSDNKRFEEVFAKASAKLHLRRIDDSGPFNFSRLVNLGVRMSEGEIALLLNDDVEAIEMGWLHRMVESALEPRVGCVGARLVYPDRTIQHAGVTLGLSGVCGHLWKGLAPEEADLIPQVVLPSQRMAVTGACLAVRRDLFDHVGGLDEISFPIAFNDFDFCLRIRALGYHTVYRGDAALIHHESQSRGPDDATMKSRKRLTRETAAFLDRWREVLRDDPFGSPAFDPLLESGAIHPSLRE